MAKKYHPDVCKDPNGLVKMQEVNYLADALLNLNIQRQPSPRIIRVNVRHNVHSSVSQWYGDYSATSTSTYTPTTSTPGF